MTDENDEGFDQRILVTAITALYSLFVLLNAFEIINFDEFDKGSDIYSEIIHDITHKAYIFPVVYSMIVSVFTLSLFFYDKNNKLNFFLYIPISLIICVSSGYIGLLIVRPEYNAINKDFYTSSTFFIFFIIPCILSYLNDLFFALGNSDG